MKKTYTTILSSLAVLALGVANSSTMSARDYVPVEYDVTYSNLETDPLNVEIQVATEGVLTVTQKGTADSYLFDTPDPSSIEDSIISDGYTYDQFDAFYLVHYNLTPGTYYYTTDFPGVLVRSASFSFETIAAGENTIQNGVAFKAGVELKDAVYIPSANGVLTVSTDYPGNLLRNAPFLFTNSLLTDSMDAYDTELTETGSSYKFSVQGAKTYYFHYSSEDVVTFTFNLAENAVPDMDVAVTAVYPAPGDAFDPSMYFDGVQVIFNPVNVNWDKVEFSYTPTGASEPVVKEVKGCSILGGALRLTISDLYEEALSEVEDGDFCTVTVYNVNYDGAPLNISKVKGAEVSDGNLTLQYEFAVQPTLVSASLPKVFYNYWEEGENAGKAVFTFSSNISKAETASVIFAKIVPMAPSGGDEPPVTYYIQPEIEGNVVTYDLTGQTFTGNGNIITFYVPSFTAENGLLAYCGEWGVNYLEYISYEDKAYDGEEPGIDPGQTMGEGENIGTLRNYSAFLVGSVQLTWDFTELHQVSDFYATLTDTYGMTQSVNSINLIEADPNAPNDPGLMTLEEEEYASGNVLVISLDDPTAAKGTYVLTVPAGLVSNNDGLVNPEQTFTITIAEVVDGATLTPASDSTLNVEEDGMVSVMWDGFDNLSYNEQAIEMFATSGSDRYNFAYGEEVTIEDGALKIDLSSLTDGNYELCIPEAYVIFNDGEGFNGEIYASYIITGNAGISGLEADANGLYNVYGVNGVKVLSTADVNALNSLVNGLYIINGSKVIIRK